MAFPPDRPAFSFPAAPVLDGLRDHSPLVLLESSLPSRDDCRSLVFLDPLEIVTTDDPREVHSCLERLNAAWREGLWAAGYLAYEAGYSLEEALQDREVGGDPLLWWGIFREPYVFDHRVGTFTPPLPLPGPEEEQPFVCSVSSGQFSRDEESYAAAVERIHEHIAAGDTYQVNLTMRYRFSFEGAPEGLYLSFRDNQPVPYGAFIRHDGRSILSASPELFLRRDGLAVEARPMKGTLRRGRSSAEDRRLAGALREDPKNRAENVMIVDLLRNDLGRICRPGSVETKDLYRVETYDTLLQMTSKVTGMLTHDLSLREMLGAVFPCGSVTGAPKISTMKIIADLEGASRGVYCGAIGYLGPGGQASFSVPIRTAVIEGEEGHMGVGSGIVADSDPRGEYRECLLKARFLTHRRPPLGLIETLRWEEKEGYSALGKHLGRLDGSARFFGVPFCPGAAHALLLEQALSFRDSPLLVRLLLPRSGICEVSMRPLDPSPQAAVPICFSRQIMDSEDIFLRHKTTRREIYDDELRTAREAGLFEVLFVNERGELTEGAFTNIFLERRGVLLTPPLTSGLLPGILRQRLLAGSDARAVEQVLFPHDVQGAERIYIGNDARGLLEAVLCEDGPEDSHNGGEGLE